MYYFLCHFPKIEYSQINEIRDKFNANSKFIDPHIAVVFPVDSAIGEENLISHIKLVTQNINPFPIVISGLEKSWDYYLYLTVKEGREHIVSLHDKLYTGILETFWFKSVPFSPHITIGFFADRQAKLDRSDLDSVKVNQSKFDEAITLATKFNFNYSATVDNLLLIKREDKYSPAVKVHEFKLGITS
jgi:2'-5' RNA ligase